MLLVKINVNNPCQSKNTQDDKCNTIVCHDVTSFVSSKQPKAKNSIATMKPPTNRAKWKASGFAMGLITVIARMILAVS